MKKLILIFLFTSSLVAQVDRVEPPFWWSNMNHSDVQIMFHGKNIAQDESICIKWSCYQRHSKNG